VEHINPLLKRYRNVFLLCQRFHNPVGIPSHHSITIFAYSVELGAKPGRAWKRVS